MNKIEDVVYALSNTKPTEHNELLVEVLPCIPNKFYDYVELKFSGWDIKLHPDGTWSFNSRLPKKKKS